MMRFLTTLLAVALLTSDVCAFRISSRITRNLNVVKMSTQQNKIGSTVVSAVLIFGQFFGAPLETFALDQQYKLPPIDRKDPNRCQLISSSIGQANAARDKLYDLRECNLQGQSAAGKDLSGLIGSEADFSGVDFKEAQISKYAFQ